MNANKRFEMLRLNSLEQNDLVLYDLLREGKLDKFQQLLRDGYGLDAFILNSMVDNGLEDKIDETISICRKWHDNVFDFLVFFWGYEKTEDYWFKHVDESGRPRKLSNDCLVRHQQWNILFERKAYKEVAKNAPLEVLRTIEFDREKFLAALIKEERFTDIMALGWIDYYTSFPKMLKYLLIHDLHMFMSLVSLDSVYDWQKLGFKTENDYLQYLYEHGEKDYLAANTDYIRNHGTPEELRYYKMYSSLAKIERYDLINWDDFWEKCTADTVGYYAEKAKNWDFLCKHKQHWLLLKHFQLRRFVKSFF